MPGENPETQPLLPDRIKTRGMMRIACHWMNTWDKALWDSPTYGFDYWERDCSKKESLENTYKRMNLTGKWKFPLRTYSNVKSSALMNSSSYGSLRNIPFYSKAYVTIPFRFHSYRKTLWERKAINKGKMLLMDIYFWSWILSWPSSSLSKERE